MSVDRTVNLELISDLKTRRLISSDGSTVALSAVTFGNVLLCTARTADRDLDGNLVEVDFASAGDIGRSSYL